MPPADAEHWFVRHHCENPPDPLPPVPGTQRYIEGAQRREARRRLIEAALDQEEEQAKADVREHRSTRLRKVLGDTVETPAA